ncbi:hypothetical protein ACTFIZ_008640 [Dictyostelium cf. discoideum]
MNNEDYEIFLRSQENRYRSINTEVDVDIGNLSTGIGSQVDSIFEIKKKKKKSSSKSKSIQKTQESFVKAFIISFGNGIFGGLATVFLAIIKNRWFGGKSSLSFF